MRSAPGAALSVGPGYFATRHFDRPDGGGRLHVVSDGVSRASGRMIAEAHDRVWRDFEA